MRRRLVPLLLCLAALLPGTALPVHAQSDADLVAGLRAYRFGGDAAALDAIEQRVAAVRSQPAQRKALASALASVLATDASFDAKQFACRQLVFIAGEAQVPALFGLLMQEAWPDRPETQHLSEHLVRVLARIPGTTVDRAVERELPAASRSNAATLPYLVELAAARRDALAVPVLRAMLRAGQRADGLAVVSSGTRAGISRGIMAATALGRIGTPEAARALLATSGAPGLGSFSVAVDGALLACAARLPAQSAATKMLIYDRLDGSKDPVIRAGALRGQVQIGGTGALPLLLIALKQDGTPRQKMAADLVRTMPGKEVTLKLCGALPGLSARGKLLVLAALGDRRDRAATPAVAALAGNPDPALRVAALRALGILGDASAVPALLRAAASGDAAAKAAAQEGLTALRGRDVDQALLAALDGGAAPARVQAIEALGRRGARGVVPRLMGQLRGTPPAVCSAAAKVLRDAAGPNDLPDLLSAMLAAAPDTQPAIADAVSEVARRGGDESQRTGRLIAAYNRLSATPARVDLLTVIGQVGGGAALDTLRKAAADQVPEVRMAALSQLAEWPTEEPLGDLLRAAQAAQSSQERSVALRGYIRMVGASDTLSAAQAMKLYRQAGELASGPAEKRLVLSGLARNASLEALQYAAALWNDEALRGEAEAALVQIGRATIGAWPEETRAALAPVAERSTDEAVRKAAAEVLALPARFGDFDMAWEASPAYRQEGADYSRLFDIPFPPEEAGKEEQVAWRALPVGGTPDQPWLLDLLALWGGEQKVAYLRTWVWSETARDLVMEIGSDDGPKAWWNGQLVLSHNVARAVAPAQEKAPVKAQAGWNRLMLKITQNIMGWGACARFTNPDGSPATGLKFAVRPAGAQ